MTGSPISDKKLETNANSDVKSEPSNPSQGYSYVYVIIFVAVSFVGYFIYRKLKKSKEEKEDKTE